MEKPMIIFDLDGTLWDSAPAVADAWNIVFEKADPSLPKLTTENIHSVMGMTMKEIGQVLQPMLREELRERVFEECCRFEVEYLHTHSGTLYPKMRETLEALREDGYRLAVVSNCQCGYVEAFLKSSGAGDLFAAEPGRPRCIYRGHTKGRGGGTGCRNSVYPRCLRFRPGGESGGSHPCAGRTAGSDP